MYYQIISNHEIQARVFAHVLKKCGVYMNDYADENDYLFYTLNHWFEDYYRPYINGYNSIVIDDNVENELKSFIKNKNWNNKASCNLLDSFFATYINKYMEPSTLIVVDYPLEDLNDDLIHEITGEEYNSLENLKKSVIDIYTNWNILHIDYKKLINEEIYLEKVLQSLNLNSGIDCKTIHPHYYMLQLLKMFSRNDSKNIS
jgi:hypothetical protein